MCNLESAVGSRTISVHRDGRRLYIDPNTPEVDHKFYTTSLVPADDAENGYVIQKQRQNLLAMATNYPYAGLERIAARAYQQAGYNIHRQLYCRALPEPDINAARCLGRVDPSFLRLVFRAEEGLVRYCRGFVEPARLTAEMVLAFPTATLAIVTATNVAAAKCYHQLRRLLPNVNISQVKATNSPFAVGQVVVGTFASMGHTAIELEKRNIVIAIDAEEALGKLAQMMLLTTDARFKFFGFLPVDRRLAPSSEDRLMATFGPAALTIPRHGAQAVQVRVAWTPIRGGGTLPTNLKPSDLKRLGIWTHPLRIRRTARLANSLLGEQPDFEGKYVKDIADAIQRLAAPRIFVLVETIEHAVALAKKLHDWRLVTSPDVITEGLPPWQRRILADRLWRGQTDLRLIATTAGAASVKMATPDLVIWAGAGEHLPPLPDHWLISPSSANRELMILDFHDYHHAELSKWSRARLKAYENAGWLSPGVDPFLARIDRFLCRRQRGAI